MPILRVLSLCKSTQVAWEGNCVGGYQGQLVGFPSFSVIGSDFNWTAFANQQCEYYTQVTPPPSPSPSPTPSPVVTVSTFTLPSGEQHWASIGTNGDVYNFYWYPTTGDYSVSDASAAAGAPKAANGALSTFTLASGEQHWAYIGTNGDVYNLYWSASSSYQIGDVSAAAGAPTAADGALSTYTLPSGEQHWAYIGTNGDVYNLYRDPTTGTYYVNDASAAAGAPKAANGALSTFTLTSGEQHWAYIGTNGDVYNLYWSASSGYQIGDVSAAAGAPKAASGALSTFTLPSGQQHWAYIGTNGDVYDLYRDPTTGTYYVSDASAAVGAPKAANGALSTFTLPSGEQHWAYIGTNGDVYNLYWSAGSGYQIGDVSAAAGAPEAASGALSTFTLPSGQQHWAYIGTNGDVYDLYRDPTTGDYYVANVTAAAGSQ
jgi:predicted heme/steroid binding protein